MHRNMFLQKNVNALQKCLRASINVSWLVLVSKMCGSQQDRT